MKLAPTLSFLWHKGPAYLIFWVTARCNARCAHCFNWDIIEDAANRRDLTLAEIDRFASKLGRLTYLTLGGGEPSLRADLPDVVSCFARHCDLRYLNFVTNGYLSERIEEMVQRMVGDCPELQVFLNVSLDGLSETHDRVRQLERGFERATDTVRRVRRAAAGRPRLGVGVCTAITAHNKGELHELHRFVRDELRVHHAINLIRGRPKDPGCHDVTIEEYEALARRWGSDNAALLHADGTHHHSALMQILDKLTTDTIVDQKRTGRMKVPCKVGTTMVVLTDVGHVRPCEILEDDFGDIRDFDFDLHAMLATEKARAFVKRIADEQCYCTWECAIRNNVVFDVPRYPKVAAELLSLKVRG